MDTKTLAREDERTARIRELNDTLRTSGRGGEVYLTQGVTARGDDFVARAYRAVADFSAFTEDNDPYGEHDFGAVMARARSSSSRATTTTATRSSSPTTPPTRQ